MATIDKTGIGTGQVITATHITNIIDALDGTTANNVKFAGPVTASAPISSSAGFTGSLQGTATSANTASWANNALAVSFANVTNLPASLNGGASAAGGISSVLSLVNPSYTSSVNLTVGTFNYCDTMMLSGDMQILLGVGGNVGDEYTFFWLTGSYGVEFVTDPSAAIVSENDYKKIYTTGSVVTAKYLGASVAYGGPAKPVWALIGSLKA